MRETKNAKLRNIANSIISYGQNGPDIIALQEVENNNILSQLLDLLKPYGYIDSVLIAVSYTHLRAHETV